MPKTISFHSGTTWSRGHNIRDKRYIDKQEHIDQTLIGNNVVVCDIPVRQAYDDIFGQAIQEYNSKQKRSDRKIDSYYDKIKKDKRKNPVYECIVQIGDKDDTGNSAELEKQALLKYAKEWNIRNPHLSLIGAYIHADEPNGTVHLHIDYIPVAECSKGLKLQNSYDKALQQQGFKSTDIHHTAQIAWQNSEREALNVICKDLGIDAQHNQGVTENRGHLSKNEYIREKKRQQAQIEEELTPLKEELIDYHEIKISADEVEIKKTKIPFTNRVSVSAETLDVIEEQAKAYRVNRPEIDGNRKKETELDNREQNIVQREQQVSEREEIAEQTIKKYEDLYNSQLTINKQVDELQNRLNEAYAESNLYIRLYEESKNYNQKSSERFINLMKSEDAAYEVLMNVVQALKTFKYADEKSGYKVNFTEQQEELLDGVIQYSINCANESSHDNLVEKIKDCYGISEEIEAVIEDLADEDTLVM